MENYDWENRKNVREQSICSAFSKKQNSNAMNKIHVFSNQKYLTEERECIESLMKKRMLVTEKTAHPDNSILIAHFGKFWGSETGTKEKKIDIPNEFCSSFMNCSIEILKEDVKHVIAKKMSLNMKMKNSIAFLSVFDHQNSEARNKVKVFAIQYSSIRLKVLIETVVEKVKPVVMKNYWFEEIDISLLMAVFDIWDYRMFVARMKKREFHPVPPLQIKIFRLRR